ncbi:unnamed protein product [Peniophora sp. CBMAI 1063]|nr:unnamed protein product [Peniophora sp. CBMAI 1063]
MSRNGYKAQGLTDPVSARRLHNDGAVIFRALSVEVLRIVVSHLAIEAEKLWQEGVFNITPGLSLSHACSRWREIAITTPDIWTIIPLTNTKWARECLSRSQTLPIRFLADPSDSERAKQLSLKQLERVQMLVTEQEDDDDEGCPALWASAPVLEYMRIMFAFPSERQPAAFSNFFGGQAPPRLREVSITSAALCGPTIPFLRARTIKSLNFSCCTLWNTLEDMLDTLSCVPELEELMLEYSTIIINRPSSWDPRPSIDMAASPTFIPLQLAHLRNLWFKTDFFQAALVLRHISLPQDIHTLGLQIIDGCPMDRVGDYYKALFLPTLSPILHEFSEQPLSSRRLAFTLSSGSFDIMASKPLRPGVVLSRYAGRHHVITNDRAGDGSFLRLQFRYNSLTESGYSLLESVAETAPALFSVGSLTLKGDLDEALALSEVAWPTALRHMHVAEHLELDCGGSVGFVYHGSVSWIEQNQPHTLCLRNVTLDTTTGFNNPEDFEESQKETFFDLVREKVMRPWLKSNALKRVIVRDCPLQPWMLDELEALVDKEGVDWDHVFRGQGVVEGKRAPYDAELSSDPDDDEY